MNEPKGVTRSLQCSVFLIRFPPFLRGLPLLNRDTLRAGAVAEAIGAVVPATIAARFGSSWHRMSGPTTAAAIILLTSLSAFTEVGSYEYTRLALTLTFMVGIIGLVTGTGRLGTLINFISRSVVVGFTAGAASLLGTNRVNDSFGVAIPRGVHFHEVVVSLVEKFDKVNPYVAVVALVTLFAGILAERCWPRIPYTIIAMVAGSAVSVILDALPGHNATGIQTVGTLPASLPPLSGPDLTLATLKDLAPVAVAATPLALTEAVSIARSGAARSGQHLVASGNSRARDYQISPAASSRRMSDGFHQTQRRQPRSGRTCAGVRRRHAVEHHAAGRPGAGRRAPHRPEYSHQSFLDCHAPHRILHRVARGARVRHSARGNLIAYGPS